MPDDMPDLTDPEVLNQIFQGFAADLSQLVEGQKRLIAMTNYLSGESLALASIVAAMRSKTAVTVTSEEALAALGPLLRPEAQEHAAAIRDVVKDEIDRLLAAS